MTCMNCQKHLARCQCPGVDEKLKSLCASDYVYVGNIIESRIEMGLSQPETFAGVNIHHPMKIAPPDESEPYGAVR